MYNPKLSNFGVVLKGDTEKCKIAQRIFGKQPWVNEVHLFAVPNEQERRLAVFLSNEYDVAGLKRSVERIVTEVNTKN